MLLPSTHFVGIEGGPLSWCWIYEGTTETRWHRSDSKGAQWKASLRLVWNSLLYTYMLKLKRERFLYGGRWNSVRGYGVYMKERVFVELGLSRNFVRTIYYGYTCHLETLKLLWREKVYRVFSFASNMGYGKFCFMFDKTLFTFFFSILFQRMLKLCKNIIIVFIIHFVFYSNFVNYKFNLIIVRYVLVCVCLFKLGIYSCI